jgi:hypothetical protein
MTAELKAHGDPRMVGKGDVYECYPISTETLRNFYERFRRGEKPRTDWVNEADFEKTPVE